MVRILFFLVSLATALPSLAEVPFQEKFRREEAHDVLPSGHAFRTGEQIGGGFQIWMERDFPLGTIPNQIELWSDDIADSRYSDRFKITLSSADYAKYRQMVGYHMTMTIEIVEPVVERFVMDDTYVYKAKILKAEPKMFDPTVDKDLLLLNKPTRVLSEGVVTALKKTGDYSGVLTLNDSTNHVYDIQCIYGLPDYTAVLDGHYDILIGAPVSVGDRVRLFTIYDPSQHRLIDKDSAAVLLQLNRSGVLTADAKIARTRTDLSKLSDLMATKKWPEARIVTNEILSQTITGADYKAIQDQWKSVPKQEQPMISAGRSEIDTLDALFQKKLGAMSGKELLTFAMSWAAGKETATPGVSGDQTYIYRMIEDLITPAQMEALVRLAVETRLAAVEKRIDESPQHSDVDIPFELSYQLETSVKYLDSNLSPESIRYIYQLYPRFLAADFKTRFSYFAMEVAETLDDARAEAVANKRQDILDAFKGQPTVAQMYKQIQDQNAVRRTLRQGKGQRL
jgi:hypothetical protein